MCVCKLNNNKKTKEKKYIYIYISLYLILKQRCFLSHISLVWSKSHQSNPIQNPKQLKSKQPTNKKQTANFLTILYTNTVVTSSLKKQQTRKKQNIKSTKTN